MVASRTFETFVNQGPLSHHCHSHPRLLFRWTILSATGPGGDDDAAARSGGARLTGPPQYVVVAAKEKSALRMPGTNCHTESSHLIGCLGSMVFSTTIFLLLGFNRVLVAITTSEFETLEV